MDSEDDGKPRLFAWGANSFGQLGLGDTSDSFLPQQVIGFPDQQVIKAISGGGGHTVATTVSGEIYVCGQNSDGQLGLNHTCDVTHFTLCTAIVNLHVSKVACGWNFTIILTNNGELLSCGSNNFSQLGRSGEGSSSVPRPVDVCKKIVVDVAAGLRHALAITDDRRLFQWGTGIASHAKRFVQKNSVPVIFTAKEPSPVQGLEDIRVKEVTSGAHHCVALSDTGELYVWGRNQHGQLLHQDLFVLQPWKVGDHFFLGEKIRAVWSGWSHLLAKTESGKLFSWGRGNYCQLGRALRLEGDRTGDTSGHHSEGQTPDLIPSLTSSSQVACGSEHNLAINGGLLYSWGWNEHGMCGVGSETNVSIPAAVGLPPSVRTELIGCGVGHSMVLCSKPG